MNLLVINAGSSSLKYQLIDSSAETVIAKGLVERIGMDGSNLKHTPAGRDAVRITFPMENHVSAIKAVLNALINSQYGVIKSMDEIQAVGHRVVHGGEDFASSALIDDSVIDAIEKNIELAPLHNPANLMGISACREVMPTVPMVAVFDTAFHQTMPREAFLYGLPYEYYERYKVRRYGFHGTSHFYVSRRAAQMMEKPVEELRTIVCHLGNGSSVTAVKYGKSVDTSMGLTPLEGVMMGTRSGDLDPAILEFIMKKEKLDIDGMMNILNKKSGLLGLGGVSSDARDNWAAVEQGNQRAKDAMAIFAYRVKKYLGAYAAAMGGVDCIAMTAGIGENDQHVREGVLSGLEYMGVVLDKEKNLTCPKGKDTVLSTPDSKVKILLVATDEEMTIARETLALVKKG